MRLLTGFHGRQLYERRGASQVTDLFASLGFWPVLPQHLRLDSNKFAHFALLGTHIGQLGRSLGPLLDLVFPIFSFPRPIDKLGED